MNKEVIISPIFYMGNKKKLIKKGLIDLFPKNINTFVDVFGGSGIVSINTEANRYILNDIDTNLLRLYKIFADKSADEIIKHIESRIDEYGLARERTKRNEYQDKQKITEYKNAYMNFRNYYNITQQDLDFYTLMFYSFSQQFRFNNKGEFNMPCGNDCFSENNKTYIKNGCNFFQNKNVCITNYHFERFTLVNFNKNDFVYLDPPYINTTATYNENDGWSYQDETKLLNLCNDLTSKGIKWAMSNVFENKGVTNQHLIDWVNKHNYNVHYFDGFSYVSCGKGNAKTVEVLITNY
jgi:DNA adenine methylase Dam